jgi:hypothetical protein
VRESLTDMVFLHSLNCSVPAVSRISRITCRPCGLELEGQALDKTDN